MSVQFLADLGLSPSELESLCRQGFVGEEYRGARGPYYKLRYRHEGRQRVRYLGRDSAAAEQIRQELERLQMPGQQDRLLEQLASEARRALRATKQNLAKPLAREGYYFHGLAIRRRRRPRSASDREASAATDLPHCSIDAKDGRFASARFSGKLPEQQSP